MHVRSVGIEYPHHTHIDTVLPPIVGGKGLRAPLPRQHPPLLLYLHIIPAQTVEALDHQRVSGREPAQHFPIQRAVKILAGLLFHDNIPGLHAVIPQRDHLPVLVLIFSGNAGISVSFSAHS